MERTVLTTLNITHATPGGSAQRTIKANLPLDTPFTKLSAIVQPLIDLNIPPEKYSITPGNLSLNVTKGPSTYDGNSQINIEEPLAQYYKDFRRHHGRASGAKSSSESSLESIDKQAYDNKKNSLVEWNRPREAPPKGCPKNCVFEAEIWPFPCPNFAFLRPQFLNPCPDIAFLRDFGGQVRRSVQGPYQTLTKHAALRRNMLTKQESVVKEIRKVILKVKKP